MKTEELIKKLSNDGTQVSALSSHAQSLSSLMLIGVAWIAIAITIIGVRPDIYEQVSSLKFLTVAALLISLLISSGYSLVAMRAPDAKKPSLSIALSIASVLVWIVMVTALSGDIYLGFPTNKGFGCGIVMSALTVAVFFSVVYNLRRARPIQLTLASVSALCMGIASGAIVLHLHCPLTDVSHIATWHVMPALLIAASAELIFSRFFRW